MKIFLRLTITVATLCILEGCASSNRAPKVDLDEHQFTAVYLQLPNQSLDSSYHTFEVNVESGLTSDLGLTRDQIEQSIYIDGWKKLNYGAHIEVSARFEDVLIMGTEVKEKVDIQKDKDGKETNRKSSYYGEITYSFGSRATVTDYKGQLISNITMANRAQRQKHYTNYYNSSAEARAFLVLGLVSMQAKLTRDCINNAIAALNQELTFNYGFRETRVNDALLVLDSRAHPEYDANRRAFLNFKQVISRMNSEEPLDEIRQDMKPVIDYYNSVKKNYYNEDKRDRRLLYASYYNLAKIYYYLDMPESAMNEANELIMNGYATRDGEQLEAVASNLQLVFRQSKYGSRHFPIQVENFRGPEAVSSSNR